MANSNPAPRAGLSLYANLLDPDASATISKGPVAFKQPDSSEDIKRPQFDPAALRFQPTKRPQVVQKPKPKTSFPKATVSIPGEQRASQQSLAQSNTSATRPAKTTLADWTGGDDEDVNGFYGGEKRQRGGRKAKKKKNKEEHVIVQDWDDIYDPTRPNSYEEYKHSDEKIREVREWKDRLYAHRMARRASSEKSSDGEGYRPQMSKQFAPPSNYNFAPPPIDSPPPPPTSKPEDDNSDSYSPPPPPPPPPAIPAQAPPQPVEPPQPLPVGAISRAPVRYNLPPPPSEIPSSEAELEKALAEEPDDGDEPEDVEEAPRSTRPGQKGFAERLMSKYGWSKGKGLGADGSGMITPLSVKVEKRKKKSDAEGGGYRDPGGRGKIIGGKKAGPKTDDVGKFGAMSEVIVLRGMVDGMDLDAEVEGSGDGGIMQEIGDECAEKYGRVERVYIDRQGAPKVFVKFTSQLSGLRAVNALEGRIFNGNTISALFYDTEKFEQGIYE